MKTSATLCCCLFLLACLLPTPSVALDSGAECLLDCMEYGVSLLCSCDSLEQDLSAAMLKRGSPFPFRYGKRGLDVKRQMPFRYGKRSAEAEKRQFRYGKRSAPGAGLLGYNPQSASAYNHLSSLAEEQ
ncbi:uncharacterized protein LOC143290179 [Babylonia areolata]|uniref:uncharacterized protein LOC143290179 n=1 Tax=Babylonia areolata TaxID=304850 RepID=UPI003FD4E9C3